jgi:hypothetical protein
VVHANSPRVLEGKLIGLDVDEEIRVQNFGGGFYTDGFLSQSEFRYNRPF